MRYKEIVEARKNPEQNPKTAINQIIAKRWQQARSDTVANTPNLFVSFTTVDKLGINPKSKYDTPIGIYAYPADYVVHHVGGTNSMRHLPFAGESPFVNLFSVKSGGDVIDVSDMSAADLRHYYAKLEDLWLDNNDDSNQNDEIEHIIDQAPQRAKFPDLLGGQFWFVTMRAAQLLAPKWKTTAPVAWNKIFRSIGIAGAVDTKGAGIIHTSEPTQAVFFSTNVIKNVERHDNKYSPEITSSSKAYGDFRDAEIKKIVPQIKAAKSVDELYHLLDTKIGASAIKYVKDPMVRAKLIVKKPEFIVFVERPTPMEQYAALRADPKYGMSIQGIIDITVLTKLIKLGEKYDSLIDYAIYNYETLPEELQLIMVERDPERIYEINDPTANTIKRAIDLWDPEVNGDIPHYLVVMARHAGIQNDKLPAAKESPFVAHYKQQIELANAELQKYNSHKQQLLTAYANEKQKLGANPKPFDLLKVDNHFKSAIEKVDKEIKYNQEALDSAKTGLQMASYL